MSDDPLAATEWRRLNARMLLIHPIETLIRLLPALIALVIARASSHDDQRWELLAVPVILAYGAVRWLTTRYRVGDGQIELRRGLLTKQTTTARLDKVRTVDLTAKVYHRVLGLAKVEISTGGTQRDRLVLDSLLVDEGRRLRAELLHRVDPAVTGLPAPTGAPVDLGAPETPGAPGAPGAPGSPAVDPAARTPVDEVLVRLDPSWVRYAPLTTTGLVTALAGFGVVAQGLGRFDDEGLVERASSVSQFSWYVDAFLVLLLVSALAAAAYVLTFWGFTLTRNPLGSLHTRRGLLTTRETSIDHARVRGIRVDEPLGLRLAGARRLKVVTTGLLHEQGGSDWLCPPAPRDVVTGLAREILPDATAVTMPLRSHGRAALRRRLVRALLPAALLGVAVVVGRAVTGWSPLLLLLVPALLLAGLALALDRYRSLGHGVTPRHLVSRSGSLDRQRVVLDRDGIIGWKVQQSFFQRRSGIATLVATTAAGSQHYDVVDLPVEQAYAVLAGISPDLAAAFA